MSARRAAAERRPGSRDAAVARVLFQIGLAGMLILHGLANGGCAAPETRGDGRGGGAGIAKTGPGEVAVGRSVPDLKVERLDGAKLTLRSLQGKVVLLDVWASWCIPCLKELPMLDGIARRLRTKGVEVVAVSIDQERDNMIKFLESQPRWELTIAHDPEGVIAETLQPKKMPTSYAIDRAGIVRYINEGFEPSDAAAIERKLTELAAQK